MHDRRTHNQLLDNYERSHHPPAESEASTDAAGRSLHLGVALLVCAAALLPFMLALVAGADPRLALAVWSLCLLAAAGWGVVRRGWRRFPIGLIVAAAVFAAVGYYVYARVDLGYW